MSREPEILISGGRVTLRQGAQTLLTAPLPEVLQQVGRGTERSPSCGILPAGVRLWHERGDAVAVVIEVAPHARTVRWLAEDSKADFGPAARYRQSFIAFPYVELLLVFRRGALTEFHQLYYRREPLDAGDELLLPNLYNVAEGYGQRCWVCLVNMRNVARLPWPEKIRAVVDHVFTSAFNRSSEVHEGNSYFTAARIDPRVASLDAWQEATRENPRFVLEVKWKPAETTAAAELMTMLDRVVAPTSLRTATDLAGLLTQAGQRGNRS